MDKKLVGYISVDAGLCWIGDPCYILHQDKLPEALGENWNEFCDKLYDEGNNGPTMKSFEHYKGNEGLGCVVSTGFGDGLYPVYAYVSDEGEWGKRIMGVYIDFNYEEMADEEDEDAEEDAEEEDGTW